MRLANHLTECFKIISSGHIPNVASGFGNCKRLLFDSTHV
jgi:hypothetical protein